MTGVAVEAAAEPVEALTATVAPGLTARSERCESTMEEVTECVCGFMLWRMLRAGHELAIVDMGGTLKGDVDGLVGECTCPCGDVPRLDDPPPLGAAFDTCTTSDDGALRLCMCAIDMMLPALPLPPLPLPPLPLPPLPLPPCV